ncbi:hypothetical protein Ddye_032047 [Dipteronia dyeriana]|uniref:Hydroxyacylglutathione hydrolase C-terminal domain-containing protein n=1 Tax=Dipteronia dyeriana TaxID=168575 RepID=A0AAD9TKN6_9ROSI|nr:hypothetical protein Ddye_032047 [Dipteronia dyeriana]
MKWAMRGDCGLLPAVKRRGRRIIDECTKEAAIVDPVEPEKVLEAAKQHGADPHHPPSLVYGGSLDNVKGCTDKVENGDKISLGANVNILSLHTPCHTKGHISYYVTGKDGEDPAVFTGDTGKLREGFISSFSSSLVVEKLTSLPKPTQVYCGNEYTVKNLQFAPSVEPDNTKIQQNLSWAQQQRQSGMPTVPPTIEEETETNPFIWVDLPELQELVGFHDPIEALREIRQRKDNWRG